MTQEEKREYNRQYRLKNKERLAEQKKQYRSEHKERIAEYDKQRYLKNKERIAEQQKQYRSENKERIAEQHKQYRSENKERIAENRKQYYQDNKERELEYQKQYRSENKERIAERKKQHNSTKEGRAANISGAYKLSDQQKGFSTEQNITSDWIIENIFSGQSCIYCGDNDFKHLGADRIDNTKPHTPDNVVCACGICNMERSDKYSVEEFKQYRALHPIDYSRPEFEKYKTETLPNGTKVLKKKK